MALIVTGTIGIDSVYTPDGQAEKVLGGSCTYFAAAASFYAPVRVVAAVGGDFPARFDAVLAGFRGVDLTGLERRPASKTFAWGGRYAPGMNARETLYTELGVLAEEPPAIPESYRDSRLVFLANTHPAVQRGLLAKFPGRKLAVADTMDLWIRTARPELEALLREVDGLVLNYDEAELLTGQSNTVAAARSILKLGPSFVVVKKGEHGCLFAHREGIGALPAYPCERVVDPTGAGDTFAGGMMGYIAERMASDPALEPASIDVVRYSLAHGTVLASFNIEAFSLDRLARLRRAEIDARYSEFARMVRVV
ncbi:MAG TPA: PfkB family carbohydrate kinase [Phycisphaerales bacterium]|nr:PfkB family carbohydrate kinase [Phycisphaerales bacterium]